MQSLTGSIKHYEWGSVDGIPNLLGIQADGSPFAEYWLGAHPSAPASIDGRPLDQFIAENPVLLGDSARLEFDGRLPYLVKLLSAAKPLSLQAHPNQLDAAEGFARENAAELDLDAPERLFKDPWAKPELLVALAPFDALAGFREPEHSANLFSALGIRPETEMIFAPLRHRSGSAGLAEVFLDCLVLDETRRGAVLDVVAAAVRHISDDGELGDFARTAVRLDEHFPGDPSLLAALLLNRLTLQPGEALHVSPGTLHTYLSGTGIEVMGGSDNVLRGGLTKKHIDPSALVQVVDFTPNPMLPLHAESQGPGLQFYPTHERSFALWRLDLQPGRLVPLPAESSGRILICTDGEIGLSSGSDALVLRRGEAGFVAAGEQLAASGSGQGFLAATGTDA